MSEKETSLSTKVLFVVYRVEWWGCLDSLCKQECLKDFEPEQLAAILPKGATMVDY